MPLKVVVTILPRQGKEERTWEQLHWLASQVKQHEPNVTSYRYGRNDGTYGEKGIVVVMEINSKEALNGRRDLAHHQEIARLIKDEDLLREPLRYFVLTEEGGW